MKNKKSILFAGITILIWSTLSTVAKLVMESIPGIEALAVSSLIAFFVLLICNIFTCKLRIIKKYHRIDFLKMAGLGFLGLFIYTAFYYKGLDRLTAQQACILNYLWPIMIMIFAVIILGEKMTIFKGISMVCSFLGIVVLTMSGTKGSGGGMDRVGVLLCISAAAAYGLFSVLNKKSDYDQSIAMMIIWLTTAVCSFISGPLLETWVPIRGSAWLGILWMGAAQNAAAYLLWAIALREAENTSFIANLAYLTPFLSVILSAAVLGEKITAAAIVSLVLIVGGIVLQQVFGNIAGEKTDIQGKQ